MSGQLRDRAGEFDAGRSRADDDERKPGLGCFGLIFSLGRFERGQNATPNFGRVLNGLQTRRKLLPLRVSKIKIGGAGRHDQCVVRNPPVHD